MVHFHADLSTTGNGDDRLRTAFYVEEDRGGDMGYWLDAYKLKDERQRSGKHRDC